MVTTTDIFQIDGIEHGDGSITAVLKINPDSEIFKGHFPGQPVVPGACMLQTVKDVLESSLNQLLILKKADNIKFISMIVPGSLSSVKLNITYKIIDGLISLNATITSGEVISFKFQGSFLIK